MTPSFHSTAIDAEWYLDVVSWARHTPWLHEPAKIYTVLGFVLLGLVCVAVYAGARRRADTVMAAVVAVPVATVLAFVVNDVIKNLVQEVRPCRVLHVTTTVLPCDPPTDYAFPSNHTVVAIALAVGVMVAMPRWGWLSIPLALLMGASRVYVGAHYPHDVIAALVIGALLAALVGLAFRVLLARAVGKARGSWLRWLLGPGVSGRQQHTAATVAEVSVTRWVAESSTSSPRLPALQNTVGNPAAEESTTTGNRFRWPNGEIPPAT